MSLPHALICHEFKCWKKFCVYFGQGEDHNGTPQPVKITAEIYLTLRKQLGKNIPQGQELLTLAVSCPSEVKQY